MGPRNRTETKERRGLSVWGQCALCVGAPRSLCRARSLCRGPAVLSRRRLHRAPAGPGAVCVGPCRSLCWAPPLSLALFVGPPAFERESAGPRLRERRALTQRASDERRAPTQRAPGAPGPSEESERVVAALLRLLLSYKVTPSGQQKRDCARSPNWVPGGVRLGCLFLVPTSLRFGPSAHVLGMCNGCRHVITTQPSHPCSNKCRLKYNFNVLEGACL